MKREQVVKDIREKQDFISKYLYDFSKDDLRRLVIELDSTLYDTAKKLARESLRGQDSVLLEVYGELADTLTDSWTYDGEWDEEDKVSGIWEKMTEDERSWMLERGFRRNDVNKNSNESTIRFLHGEYACRGYILFSAQEMERRLEN